VGDWREPGNSRKDPEAPTSALREGQTGTDLRFHFLYDKVWREDILAHAYALCRSNGGAPGVDGETFGDIDAYGVDRWLGELREEVRASRYQPQPVRRVMIPKPGGAGEGG
jgi:RNA-directed DNA polymerase